MNKPSTNWKIKILSKTNVRTSTVMSISKRTKSGYITIKFENGDIAQSKLKSIKVFDELTYKIIHKSISSKDRKFIVSELSIEDKGKTIEALSQIDIKNILFISILQISSIDDEIKSIIDVDETKTCFNPDTSKIIGISTLSYTDDGHVTKIFIKGTEQEILKDFCSHINQFDKDVFIIGGSNVTSYLIPAISKRLMVNGIEIPKIIDFSALKPYEIECFDISKIWRFGSYFNTSTAVILCNMGIDHTQFSVDCCDIEKMYINKDYDLITKLLDGRIMSIFKCAQKMLYVNI